MQSQKPLAAGRPDQNGRRRVASDSGGLDDLKLLARMQAFLEQQAQGIDPAPELERACRRFIALVTPVIRSTLARRGIRNRWLLDDLTQDVWVEVLKRLVELDPHGRRIVSTWVRVIAARSAATFWRNPSRRRSAAVSPEELACMEGNERDPASRSASNETVTSLEEKVDEVRDSLSPENQKILDDYILADCPAKCIADEIGVTEGAVRDRASRIRRQLRDSLPEP